MWPVASHLANWNDHGGSNHGDFEHRQQDNNELQTLIYKDKYNE